MRKLFEKIDQVAVERLSRKGDLSGKHVIDMVSSRKSKPSSVTMYTYP